MKGRLGKGLGMDRNWTWMIVPLGLGAAPALAHPHVFVDAGITAIFAPDGRIEAIEVTWTYDDLYSLMITEERKLDPDGDGQLTEGETASLQGFDMAWSPGFAGDTHLLLDDQKVEIGGPSDWTARLEGGYLISTHVRHLAVPVRPNPDKPLIMQSYDPDYYIAYRIMDAHMLGEDASCQAVIYEFDAAAADAALTAASAEYAASTDPNAPFPRVGAAYSDEVRVACTE